MHHFSRLWKFLQESRLHRLPDKRGNVQLLSEVETGSEVIKVCHEQLTNTCTHLRGLRGGLTKHYSAVSLVRNTEGEGVECWVWTVHPSLTTSMISEVTYNE